MTPHPHPRRPPQRFAWAPRGLAAPWAVRPWATAPSVSLSLSLTDGKRLSDYSIGPNSKLNLVVKPLEKVLLEESTARKSAEAPAPPPAAWTLISRVLAQHFSAADASRVLDQLQRVRSVAQDLCVLPTCLCPSGPPAPSHTPESFWLSLFRIMSGP